MLLTASTALLTSVGRAEMSSYMPQCSILDIVVACLATRVKACKAHKLGRVPLSSSNDSTSMRECHLMGDGS